MISRKEILQTLDSYPPLTIAVQETIKWMQLSNKNPSDIVNIVQDNKHLTEDILQIANSNYFNKNTKVESLHDIIVNLGEDIFFQLTVILGTIHWFKKTITNDQNPTWRLWDHCIAVGVGVDQLASMLEIKTPQYLFVSGFLHDIGKAVFEKKLMVDSSEIIDFAISKSLSVDAAERKLLGIDHMEIGATILTKWDMPSSVVNSVRWHHQPMEFDDDAHLIDMVHLSDAITLTMGLGPQYEGMNYHICSESAQRLGVKTGLIDNLILNILDHFDPLIVLFAPIIGEVA